MKIFTKTNTKKNIYTFIKVNLYLGITSFIQLLSGILRNKIIAFYTGLSGVGIISQITNFQSVVSLFVQQGIPQALVRFLPEFKLKNDDNFFIYINSGYIVVIIIFFITSTILQIIPGFISIQLIGDTSIIDFIRISIFTGGILAINAVNESILQSLKKYKLLAKARSLNAIINVVLFYYFVIYMKIEGAVWALFTYSIISCFITIYFLKNFLKNGGKIIINKIFNVSIYKSLVKIGIVVSITLLFTNLALLIIRIIINRKLGIESNGLFHSVWAFTTIINNTIIASLSSYILPKINETDNVNIISDLINDSITAIILIMIPITFLVLLFKTDMLQLFYSSEFISASTLLGWKLVADLVFLILWIIGAPLLVMNRLKAFFVLNSSIMVIFILVSIILINFSGLNGVFIGYLVSNMMMLVVYLFDARNKFKFKLSKTNYFLTSAFIFIILTLEYFLPYFFHYKLL